MAQWKRCPNPAWRPTGVGRRAPRVIWTSCQDGVILEAMLIDDGWVWQHRNQKTGRVLRGGVAREQTRYGAQRDASDAL